MKISKRTREEAALVCSMAASNQHFFILGDYVPGRAWRLAGRALLAARERMPRYRIRTLWAEAEALVRTGRAV